jgi:hypothetical protein
LELLVFQQPLGCNDFPNRDVSRLVAMDFTCPSIKSAMEEVARELASLIAVVFPGLFLILTMPDNTVTGKIAKVLGL